MTFKMKALAIGVLKRSDKYFLARRSGRDYHGCWEFPGRRYGENEAWADAVVEEWRDGLSVEVRPRYAFFDETFTDLYGMKYNAVAGWLDCESEPVVGKFHSESIWVSAQEILELIDTSPTTKPIVTEILRSQFIRASGDTLCKCGKPYRKHSPDMGLLGWEDQPFLNILCDGTRVKL